MSIAIGWKLKCVQISKIHEQRVISATQVLQSPCRPSYPLMGLETQHMNSLHVSLMHEKAFLALSNLIYIPANRVFWVSDGTQYSLDGPTLASNQDVPTTRNSTWGAWGEGCLRIYQNRVWGQSDGSDPLDTSQMRAGLRKVVDHSK